MNRKKHFLKNIFDRMAILTWDAANYVGNTALHDEGRFYLVMDIYNGDRTQHDTVQRSMTVELPVAEGVYMPSFPHYVNRVHGEQEPPRASPARNYIPYYIAAAVAVVVTVSWVLAGVFLRKNYKEY